MNDESLNIVSYLVSKLCSYSQVNALIELVHETHNPQGVALSLLLLRTLTHTCTLVSEFVGIVRFLLLL